MSKTQSIDIITAGKDVTSEAHLFTIGGNRNKIKKKLIGYKYEY